MATAPPKHALEELVKGAVHAKGIGSLWSTVKQVHKRVVAKLSLKQLDGHVQEFPGHHKMREQDAINQPELLSDGTEAKRVTFRVPTAPNGVPSGGRI